MGEQRNRMKTESVLSAYQKNKFVKDNPQLNLTVGEISNIIKTFNENLIQESLNNKYGVLLPFKLGHIYLMNAGKRKTFALDMAKTISTGRKVYFKNWETDNNTLRIVFTTFTHRAYIKFSNILCFKASKKFRKLASEHFKKHWFKCVTVKIQTLMHIK